MMKVTLSNKESTSNNKNHFTNIALLAENVLDAEANSIVCDNFISSFSIDELPNLLSLICSKLRMGAALDIIDIDSDILFKRSDNQEITLEEINQILFNQQNRKCIFDIDTISKHIPDYMVLSSAHYDYSLCSLTLSYKRSV